MTLPMRTLEITEHTQHHASSCVEIHAGNTKIICAGSVLDQVPRFLRNSNHGWLTAEYQMLPFATHTRVDRDVTKGKLSARSSEIQRLIGRSFRNSIDIKKLPPMTLILDHDVIQADGSTRCHAINGGQIALVRTLQRLQLDRVIKKDPLRHLIGAVSAGIIDQQVCFDLDYQKDHQADVDINIVMTEHGDLVEIQGTAEREPLSRQHLNQILDGAWPIISSIIDQQKSILNQPYPYKRT
ncbi:ribonuclease PH [Gammaproteobacteria bacterium]|nr:ribonuclease PH [Gammaproteobacteria bacterium]